MNEARDEGGPHPPRSMAGVKVSGVRPSGWFVLLLTVGLLQAPILAQAIVVQPSTSLADGIDTEMGGRSLLVEELTTTWCKSCAEIDPYLMGVADAHGSRIALAAYHPNDGEDAFSPPAAEHRIDRLRSVNPDLPGTPSFLVEGRAYHTGTDAWVDVQRDILDEEVNRQTFTQLQFSVKSQGETITATLLNFNGHGMNTSQLTFMVLEHGKAVPKNSPGEATRDRVVIATAECEVGAGQVTTSINLIAARAPTDCLTDFTIEFTALASFSVILLHENTAGSITTNQDLGTYGAVEFAFRDRDEAEAWSPAWVVLGGAAVIGLLVFRKKA